MSGRLRAAYGRVLDGVIDAAAAVAAAMLVLQVVAISVEVCVRYLFGLTSEAVTSFSSWSLVYIAFLGVAWLQRLNGHVRIDIVLIRMPPALRRWADLFALALGAACCAVVTWFGLTVTWNKFATNAYDFFALPYVPIYTIYIVIPFGALLFLLQLCRDFAAAWRTPAGSYGVPADGRADRDI